MRSTTSILVSTDFSDTSRAAFPLAVQLQDALGAPLVLAHAVPSLAYMVGAAAPKFVDYQRAVEEQAEVELQALLEQEPLAGRAVTGVVINDTPVAPAILDCAIERGAGLIVVANHGRRGAKRLVLGSVTEELMRTSQVPVLTTGREARTWREDEFLLVPVDFTEGSEDVVRTAASLAPQLGLNLHLVHMVEPPIAPILAEGYPEAAQFSMEKLEAAAEEKLEHLATELGVSANTRLTVQVGGAADGILTLAAGHDTGLIAIGSHGRRGIGRAVLGSVAETVTRNSKLPVLVVKRGQTLDDLVPSAA